MMKKILIVDDHSNLRQLIRVTLSQDFEILETDNGVAALTIIRNSLPDLVVLDIMMPGQYNGLAVLDIMKTEPQLKHVRVIMVSARGQLADFNDAIKRGADDYFIKPFSPMKLAATIKTMLLGDNPVSDIVHDQSLPAHGQTLRLAGGDSNAALHEQLYCYAEDLKQMTTRYEALDAAYKKLSESSEALSINNAGLIPILERLEVLVNESGGTIGVDSQSGLETVVTLTVPAASSMQSAE